MEARKNKWLAIVQDSEILDRNIIIERTDIWISVRERNFNKKIQSWKVTNWARNKLN